MTTSPTGGGTGQCLCGAVRYRYEGEPTTIGLCQCERCQRQSGSAFLIGVIFPKEAVTIEGPLAVYEARTDGNHRLCRHFCPICGSAVSITLDRYPEIRSMMGGTLDDKSKIKPTFSVWCSAGQPWLTLPEGIKCLVLGWPTVANPARRHYSLCRLSRRYVWRIAAQTSHAPSN